MNIGLYLRILATCVAAQGYINFREDMNPLKLVLICYLTNHSVPFYDPLLLQ